MSGCEEGMAIMYMSKQSEGRDMKFHCDFKQNLKHLQMRDGKTSQTYITGEERRETGVRKK